MIYKLQVFYRIHNNGVTMSYATVQNIVTKLNENKANGMCDIMDDLHVYVPSHTLVTSQQQIPEDTSQQWTLEDTSQKQIPEDTSQQ